MKVRISTLSQLGLSVSETKARYRVAAKKSDPSVSSAALAEFGDGQISFASIALVALKLHVPTEEILSLVGLPPRTAARRKQEAVLKADEADRLFRIARVLEDASRVFDSEDKAARWLTLPHPLLWQQRPLDLLDSDAGAKAVTDELTRIEHGDFA